ncbi:MAG: hypothetical protein NZ879_04620 [Archaeoglobaceae archaeon]|nr:hypothetical protein [Archaeoglobaceae archaeon]MDW8118247.1 hypothetical protein [Archaeoglobaceae archaeon]
MRVKLFIKDSEVLLDFEGFKGRVCVEEFEKILQLISKYGLSARVKETQIKEGGGVETWHKST